MALFANRQNPMQNEVFDAKWSNANGVFDCIVN